VKKSYRPSALAVDELNWHWWNGAFSCGLIYNMHICGSDICSVNFCGNMLWLTIGHKSNYW